MYRNILEKKLHLLKEAYYLEEVKATERKKGIAKGLIFGAMIGGLFGVLLAPDKGEVTREKAKDELLKAKENLEARLEEGKEKGNLFLDENKDRFEEVWLSTKNYFQKPSEQEEDKEDETKAEENEEIS